MKRIAMFALTLAALCGLAAPATVQGQVILEPGTLGLELAPGFNSYLSFRVKELEAAVCDAAKGKPKKAPAGAPGGMEGLWDSTLEVFPAALCCDGLPIKVLEAGDDEKPHHFGGGWVPYGEDGSSRLALTTSIAQWSADGSRALVPATPTRFCFGSRGEFQLACGVWTYTVRLNPSDPGSSARISLDLSNDPTASSGAFVAEVELPVVFQFTKKGSGTVVEVEDHLSLLGKGAWSAYSGPEIYSSSLPVDADIDCDGIPDQDLPPTTNLALGFSDQDGDGMPESSPFCLCGADGSGSLCLEPLLFNNGI